MQEEAHILHSSNEDPFSKEAEEKDSRFRGAKRSLDLVVNSKGGNLVTKLFRRNYRLPEGKEFKELSLAVMPMLLREES